MIDTQQPTPRGLEKYPPHGIYQQMPCTCLPACPDTIDCRYPVAEAQPGTGQIRYRVNTGCQCEACAEVWANWIC